MRPRSAAHPTQRAQQERPISYSTQTEHGNCVVKGLLSIRETCRLQGRRLHDYLGAAITADLNGQPIPTPLPP